MIPFFLGASSGAPAPGTVFATTLYTGNGSARTITTGINLSTPGGLVWVKARDGGPINHQLFDTQRGAEARVNSNLTNAEDIDPGSVTAFGTTGFNLGTASNTNFNTRIYVAWSFARSARFFDVVTYNGSDANAGNNYRINHGLGITPGLVICKRRPSTTGNAARDGWQVWHRSLSGFGHRLQLESTAAEAATPVLTNATSTYIEFDNTLAYAKESGITYVAYLFAHDTASDGIVQCGSYTGNGSATGPTVTLGWNPQWVMIKRATGGTGDWVIFDTARGIVAGNDPTLMASNNAEENGVMSAADYIDLTGTGFQIASTDTNLNANTATYVYLAVRST